MTRARSARRGDEKNKAPVRSPLFLLFRPLSPTNKTNRGDVKRTNQKHDPLSRKTCHLSGATRLHCSRNEELRLFLPWLRELLPKFTDLNHLNLYVDLQKAFSAKFEFNSNFFRNPKARMQGRSAVKSALGVRYFCARRFKPVQ